MSQRDEQSLVRVGGMGRMMFPTRRISKRTYLGKGGREGGREGGRRKVVGQINMPFLFSRTQLLF